MSDSHSPDPVGPGEEGLPREAASSPGKRQPPASPSLGDTRSPASPLAGVAHTRVSKTWVGLIVGALVLVLILIFVIQNGSSTRFSFLGGHFSLPLGVAMLLAAIVGVLVMAVVGSARIHQLRHAFRQRNQRGCRFWLGNRVG